MTMHIHNVGLICAPTILALGIGCALGAQSGPDGQDLPDTSPQRSAVASSIDPVEASLQVDTLVSKFLDRSSLQRVQTLEEIDASPAIMPETLNSLMLDAMDDHDPLVAEAAVRALLARDDEQVLQVLDRHLKRYPGETMDLGRVRLAARSEDLTALRKLMRNGDALVQERAFEALAAYDTDAAVDLLKKEFEDPQSLYRLQTLELLVRSPYTNSSATLKPILELASRDSDPLIRDRGKQLLSENAAETASEQ
jgi:hypothetical protein